MSKTVLTTNNIPHTCSRCFHVRGRAGDIKVQLDQYRHQGHILWEKKVLDCGDTLAILSTLQYPGSVNYVRSWK